MWVKICANTNVEDAVEAARLGADAVGFVFAPSPRRVTAAQVAAISRALPREVERVGVFCAGAIEEIVSAVEQAELTAVQMHGAVDLAFSKQLESRLGPGVSIIQTAHWRVAEDERSAAELRARLIELTDDPSNYRLLVDAHVGQTSGGLGIRFDWTRAREVLLDSPKLRLILAGGLTPGNVGEALQRLAPWGVDVATGVELQPGRKDFGKLRDFIQAARQLSTSQHVEPAMP